MIRTAIATLALGTALVAAAPASAATNLLTNGSFENTVAGGPTGLAGWTVNNGGSSTSISTILYNSTSNGAFGEAVAPSNVASPSPDAVGLRAAYFVADNALQSLSQDVLLQAGVTYLTGFDYYIPANGQRNSGGATLTATLDGTTLGNINVGTTAPVQTWFSNGQQFVSTGTTGTYRFSFAAGAAPAKDIVVDRAYVLAAVPEPATWAMMVLGFGVVGFGMRRRKSVKTTVQFA